MKADRSLAERGRTARWRWFPALAGWLGIWASAQAGDTCPCADLQSYRSPYAFTFTLPRSTLAYDFAARLALPPSDIPTGEWYDEQTKLRFKSWGPHAAQYPAQLNNSSPFFQQRTIPPFNRWVSVLEPYSPAQKEYLQQRVLAAAELFIGTIYQHHHIPQWDPYANGYVSAPTSAPNYWPWSSVSYGQGSAGIDCSDFSSYVYNFALGIKLITAVGTQGQEKVSTQAQVKQLPGPGGQGQIVPKLIPGPHQGTNIPNKGKETYDALVRQFEPGDLLFIRDMPSSTADHADVSHVVIWLGKYGTLADGSVSPEPLIINSHNNTPCIPDSNGVVPPPGVHVLPFREGNWYFEGFDHALRILEWKPEPR